MTNQNYILNDPWIANSEYVVEFQSMFPGYTLNDTLMAIPDEQLKIMTINKPRVITTDNVLKVLETIRYFLIDEQNEQQLFDDIRRLLAGMGDSVSELFIREEILETYSQLNL